MMATGFWAVWKPDLAGSAGTKNPVIFLAPQHCQPPPGSRSSQSNTTDASVSPPWADRADCGSVSRNVGSWQLLVNGVRALPYWMGEPSFSLVAGPGFGPAQNLEP